MMQFAEYFPNNKIVSQVASQLNIFVTNRESRWRITWPGFPPRSCCNARYTKALEQPDSAGKFARKVSFRIRFV